MPYIGPRGVAHGVAGLAACLDNTPFGMGGVGGWRDERTIVFANAADGGAVSQYDVESRVVSRVYDPPRRANVILAGGGYVASWLNDPGKPDHGLSSTTGLRLENAGLIAMSPDGAIAYKANYLSNDPITVRELDGSGWMLPQATEVCLMGRRRAIFKTPDGRVDAVGIARPAVVNGNLWQLKAIETPGQPWLLYYSESHGVVLHPFYAFDGYLLQPSGDAWIDARAEGSRIIVALSSRPGEVPGDISTVSVDVVTDSVERRTWVGGVWVTSREQLRRVDVRAEPERPSEPLNRPFFMIWYEFSVPEQLPPGNAEVAVRRITGPRPRPAIIGSETRSVTPVLGYRVGSEGGASVARMEEICREQHAKGIRPIFYWDSRTLVNPTLPPGTLLEINAYCGVHESLADFEKSMSRVLTEASTRPEKILLCCQAFNQNPSLTSDPAGLIPVYCRLANRFPRVIGFTLFNDAGRDDAATGTGGLTANPGLRAHWQRVMDTVTGLPTLPPLNEISMLPRVTITEYSPKSGNAPLRVRAVYAPEPDAGPISVLHWMYRKIGEPTWILAATNPPDDPDHHYSFTSAGAYEIKLIAVGPDGRTAETSRQRRIDVSEIIIPAPDPTPTPGPKTGTLSFQTHHGTYLARAGEYFIQAATASTFDVVDGRVVLGARAYALERTSGGVAIKDILTAKYLAAEEDKLRVTYRDDVGIWETFRTAGAAGAGGGARRSGIVTPDGRAVRDDSGAFHPLGLSLFWALQGWKYERDHFRANAEWASQKGFDYLRILLEVGWPGNRRIAPQEPEWGDWGTVLREVASYLETLNLRLELTMLGKGTGTDPMWLAGQVAAFVQEGYAPRVMDIECANEYDVTSDAVSIDTLVRMTRELRARTPNIVALSSPGTWDDVKRGANDAGANGFTVHLDRGNGDYGWRQARQGYDCKDARPFVTFHNEPAGPGSSVATQTNPLILAMTRAVGVMCGGAGYVFHTGTGVYGDGKPHPQAGPRPANFWEIDNIDEIVTAVRGVDSLLPDGVENWTVANTGWTSPNPVAPFQPHAYWDGPNGEGVNKAYSALAPDGRVIQMPCGVRGVARLTASYPLHDVTVYDPLTREAVFADLHFAQGEVLELPGGGEDAMRAFIIHGRR